MTVDQVKEVIADIERDVKSAKRRKQMVLFFASNPTGKISNEGVAEYNSYASTL